MNPGSMMSVSKRCSSNDSQSCKPNPNNIKSFPAVMAHFTQLYNSLQYEKPSANIMVKPTAFLYHENHAIVAWLQKLK